MYYSRKTVIDIASDTVLSKDLVSYDGPWEQCKESKQQKEAQASQNAFNQELLRIFKAKYAQQESVLGTLIPPLEAMATNPEGFGAKEYTALQAKIINDTGAQYSAASKAAATEFATTNEAGLPSGVEAQVQGALRGAAAGQVSGETSSLDIANEQLKQQQREFAMQGLIGVSSSLGQESLGFSGQEGAGLQNQFQNATTVYNQGSMWKNILGGVVGAGLDFATGGLSGILQGGSFLTGAGQRMGGQQVTGTSG